MQKTPPNPQFNQLLASLPESQDELLRCAEELQARGEHASAAELLQRAYQRCATPAISRAARALAGGEHAQDAEPDTQELEELEIDTLESTSLELNAFERAEDLDESAIFSGGSFEGLSSLSAAADAPPSLGENPFSGDDDDTGTDTNEVLQKVPAHEPSDGSVDELLVDLGLPVAQEEDDYNATRSLTGRIDEALGLQRDDLRADDSEFARRLPDSDALHVSDADLFSEDDLFFEPDLTGPGFDDDTARSLKRPSPERLEQASLAHEELALEDEWDDAADTQFQIQMPLDQPQLPTEDSSWRLGNEASTYGDAPNYQDETAEAVELESFEVPQRDAAPGPSGVQGRTDRLFAVNSRPPGHASTPAPADKPARASVRAPQKTAPQKAAAQEAEAQEAASPKNAADSRRSAASLRKYALPIVGVLLLAAIVLAAVLFASESSSTAKAIQAKIAYGRAQTTSDTYQDYLKGERALNDAVEAHGPLGAGVDGVLEGMGMMGEAEKARGQALAELVLLRAMIEYRYEALDTRSSERTLKRAEERIPGDPNTQIARAYQLLAKSQNTRAVGLLGEIRKRAPNNENATVALIHAQLSAGNIESASMATLPIRSKTNPSVHEHFLLGLVDLGLGKTVPADARFRHIIATLSPSHLSAHIKRSQSVRQTDEPKAIEIATALLEVVLDAKHEDASPLQLAHAHNAMAEVKLLQGDAEEAEAHHEKAIKLSPQRSAVYAPMVRLYIRDGRLDKALDLIKDAEDAGVSSTTLLLQRAELYRLTSRPQMAIKTIDSAELRSAPALWAKGLAYRDMDQPDQAAESFEDALKMDETFAPARASAFLLVEQGQSRSRNALEKPFETLVKQNAKNPPILHDAARALMHLARVNDTASERAALLGRSHSLLKDALKYGGDPALIHYSLCAQSMLAQKEQAALDYCEAAEKTNPHYKPGFSIAARLHLKRDHAEDGFFERLSSIAPDDPSASQYHALHWLNHHQIDKAEKAINRWAGTPAAKSTLHLFAEGRLSLARQKYTAALGYFERAHKQSPGFAPAAVYYAHTLSSLGEHERAETIVKAVLDDLEWGPVAWVVFGQIRREQERLKDAIQNLNIATKKLEGTIVTSYWITQLHLQKAMSYAVKYDSTHHLVERELSRATELGDPDSPALNMAWSRYYLAMRRPDQIAALAALKRVISVQPSHCAALRALHSLYPYFDDSEAQAEIDAQLSQYHCEG